MIWLRVSQDGEPSRGPRLVLLFGSRIQVLMFCFSDVGICRYEIYFKMNLGTYPTLLGVIDIQNTFGMSINAVFTLVWTDGWREMECKCGWN